METADAPALVESFRASLSYPAVLQEVISAEAGLIAADERLGGLHGKIEISTLLVLTSIVSYHLREPVSSALVHEMLTPKAIVFPKHETEGAFDAMRDAILMDDDLLNDPEQVSAWLAAPDRKASAFPCFRRCQAAVGVKISKKVQSGSPSTALCPFCDRLLPTFLPERLSKLLADLIEMGTPEPREGNPAGLALAPSVSITFCSAHNDWNDFVPLGKTKGWPVKLDFKGIEARLRAEKHQVILHGILHGTSQLDGEDKRGPFWRVAKEDAQMNGTKAMQVEGQMATFENDQPG